MNNNLEKCIAHLEKGIEYKRKGEYENAMNEYRFAREEYPTYKAIYNNMGKLCFCLDPRTSDLNLRCFLTYAHLTMKQDSYSYDNIEFAKQNGFYDYAGRYEPGKIITENLAYQRVLEHRDLGKIYADVNFTFNVGLAYIMRNAELTAINNIDFQQVMNHASLLLGRNYSGTVIGDTQHAPLIRNLGFFFLTNNLITNDENSEIFIANVYFRDDFPIDKI